MTNASGVPAVPASPPNPVHVLKGFATLRRLMGTYPIGQPMIAQKLKELDDQIRIHLRRGASSVRAAAEEALRHFPPAAAAAALRDLLTSRDFILQHPQIAVRLLQRADHAG